MINLKKLTEKLWSQSVHNFGAVIGEIRWFAMSTPPEGWLVCNGGYGVHVQLCRAFCRHRQDFYATINRYRPRHRKPGIQRPAVFRLPNLLGKVPWGSTSVGTVLDAGLPDIAGMATFVNSDGVDQVYNQDAGCFYWGQYAYGRITVTTAGTAKRDLKFSASRSSGIYGKSSTVQPPARIVNVWKRIS